MLTQFIHSVPAWALGERAFSAKFGGNIVTAGIPEVSNRLLAVKKLSKRLGLKGAEELRSSGHILHEIRTSIGKYKKHNSPMAISYHDLRSGIYNEKYPRWVAMTAPQFGFKGAERGGILSKDPADRVMAKDLHMEAIEWSQKLESEGLGAGINIWWPAWTARRVDDPDSPPIEFQKAWDMMLAFWVDVLGKTGGTMWLEWKPGDPGIDYLMTLKLAIEFCNAVNAVLGRIAMFINNEFAHILLSGIDVAEGVKMTIDAGLFSMFVHGNSGQMLPTSIQSMLDSGTQPEDIPILIDWDWAVGVGGPETWEDQQEAVGLMDRAGQEVIYFEHDVNPAGQNPANVFELSIRNFWKMLRHMRGVIET